MRPIGSRTHGVLDYLSGLLFIASPWLFGFADVGLAPAAGDAAAAAGAGGWGPAVWLPIAIGAATIVMALLTDYELGLARFLPLLTHLRVDALAGGLLAASPWLFGFADRVWWPHVLLGVFELAVVNLSRRVPDDRSATVAGGSAPTASIAAVEGSGATATGTRP